MRQTPRAQMLLGDDGKDPRTPFDPVGDERQLLLDFVRWQRETLEAKCAGLSPEQLATRAVEPSTMSLLGLVRHLARVEQGWWRQCVDDALATWRAECRAADAIVAVRALDDTFEDNGGGTWSIRALLLHMIEEYSRHLGHADLLRERIDGRLGE